MPIDQLVPNVAQLDELAVYWPPTFDSTGYQVGQAFVRNGYMRGGSSGPVGLFAPFTGGGFGELMALHNEIPVGRIINGAGGAGRRTYTAPYFHPSMATAMTGAANLGTFSIVPRPWRVWRVAWLMRIAAGNTLGGLTIQLTQAVGTPLGHEYGFGVTGDGAGGWRWYTNRTGVAGAVTESVALAGLTATDLNLFELEVLSGVGAGTGSVNLYVNDTAVLSRAFGAGGVLPLYSDGLPNAMAYAVGINSDDDAGLVPNAEIQIGPMTIIWSKYTKAGVEISGVGG